MKHHPRIRKTIKWGGAALTVLLVVVWIGSWGWDFDWGIGNGYWVRVVRGGLLVGYDPEKPIWHAGVRIDSATHVHGDTWWFDTVQQGSDHSLHMPLWVVATIGLLPTALAFRLDTLARRRDRMNLCKKCHYDRTGLAGGADAKCPECGTSPLAPSSPQRGDGL